MVLLIVEGVLSAQVFLSFGSNIGDREGYLRRAVEAVSNIEGSTIRRTSSIYETEPWGRKNQRAFLNQVLEMETDLRPRELLNVFQEIEKRLGRRKEVLWGPRTMDIDLLLYDGMVVEEEMIQIPHPRLSERRFVLVPLAEVAPCLSIPGAEKTVEEILSECLDQGKVKLYEGR